MEATTEKDIKLLIVDDSAFMRQLIKDSLVPYKNIKVDTASNGKVALRKIRENKPDVMTLDIEMDVMSGIELLEVMKKNNSYVPTIVLSRLTQKDSETTIKALELGAVDFIAKPENHFVAIEFDKLGKEIFEKIIVATKVSQNLSIKSKTEKVNKVQMKSNFVIPKIMVVGASTGGPGALYEIFAKLPNIKIPVIIVQHMPAGFTDSFARRLNDISMMNIKLGENGESLKPGTVYVAPGDYHMIINQNATISLNQEPNFKGVRPSVDVTLKSVAKVYGGRVLSVILTGMGNDGNEGVEEIKKLGGKCIVQNKETCVVFGMPEAIIQDENADSIVALNKIPEEIMHYLINWD